MLKKNELKFVRVVISEEIKIHIGYFKAINHKSEVHSCS